jgi:hypothetical protein
LLDEFKEYAKKNPVYFSLVRKKSSELASTGFQAEKERVYDIDESTTIDLDG